MEFADELCQHDADVIEVDYWGRCEALTAKGEQCRHSASIITPNMAGGKSVCVCRKHDNKKQRLIEGGFLQPLNHTGYGSCVRDRFVEYDENNTVIGAFGLPDYWK